MDKYTSKLRKEIVLNKKLAADIRKALAKYEFDLPKGKTVVWGPTVVDVPSTDVEVGLRYLIDGIWPEPIIFDAGYDFLDRHAIHFGQ